MKLLWSTLLLWGLALAHQPLWNPGSPTVARAFRVSEPEVSKAITGQLSPSSMAYFRFDLPAGFVLDLGLFVGGDCPTNFEPRLWLVGPGLPSLDTPFPIEKGQGAMRFSGGWKPYQGHGVVGRKGPALREKLGGGTYTVVVEAGVDSGFYMLSLGGLERPGGTTEGMLAIGRFNQCR